LWCRVRDSHADSAIRGFYGKDVPGIVGDEVDGEEVDLVLGVGSFGAGAEVDAVAASGRGDDAGLGLDAQAVTAGVDNVVLEFLFGARPGDDPALRAGAQLKY
jgi:hypothetical protein